MKTKDVEDRSGDLAADETKSEAVVADKPAETAVEKPAKPKPEAMAHDVHGPHSPELAALRAGHASSSELAKIAAGLLVGVLALMTFLLSVGLQHPKPNIRSFMYVAYVSLGLTLLVYLAENMLTSWATGKFYTGGGAKGAAKASKSVGLVRLALQVLFAVAVVGTVGFALASSQLFFITPTAQPQATTQGQ